MGDTKGSTHQILNQGWEEMEMALEVDMVM